MKSGMFGYYIDLALRSFKRNKVLTALMVLALGLGIGAFITTLTVVRLLSGDPLPQKSARLFTVELNPNTAQATDGAQAPEGNLISYMDAMNLMRGYKAPRQAAMATTSIKVSPMQPGRSPFFGKGVMTTADFFAMFDVPFQYGTEWSSQDGANGARVAVIGSDLNDKLFGGNDSVGKAIRVNDHDYQIIGVLRPWAPQPNFYSIDLSHNDYGKGDDVFLPLNSARADKMGPSSVDCWDNRNGSLETSPSCAWLSLWVELDRPADVAAYKTFLANYVQTQISAARFHVPEEWLPNLTGFLAQQQVVPDDARLQAYLAFGFLLICVVGTVGLLLSKCLGRDREISVRRALGANRSGIFAQFMVESGMVGLAGGLLGLVLAEFGLWEVRLEPVEYAHLAHLDPAMFAVTFAVALAASLMAGLLPSWRACSIVPGPQLKSA